MNVRAVERVALLLSLLAGGVLASEPSSSVPAAGLPLTGHQGASIRVDGRHGLDSVQFVMDLPSTEHRAALTAENLRRWGCLYESHDPALMARMEQLLDRSDIMADDGSEKRELRQLLTARFKDGSTMEFDF